MISSLASKWQVLKFGMPIFQPLFVVKLKASNFKVWAGYKLFNAAKSQYNAGYKDWGLT